MSSSPVMTMRAQCSVSPPRSGPLASPPDTRKAHSRYPYDPSDACRPACGLCQFRACRHSPTTCYLPSRRNRRDLVRSNRTDMWDALWWCAVAIQRLFGLIVVFLVMRAVMDLAPYFRDTWFPALASKPPERVPTPFASQPALFQTRCVSSESIGTAQAMAPVLEFVSDQIQHTTALATLSTTLRSHVRVFLEDDQSHMEALLDEHLIRGATYGTRTTTAGVNFTDLLHTPLVDFTSGGFIGKTFMYALDELDHLSSLRHSDYLCTDQDDQQARALAVYRRTASNLLLGYSASHLRVTQVLLDLRAIQQHLSWNASQMKNTLWIGGVRRRGSLRSHAAGQEIFSELATTLDGVIEDLSLLADELDKIAQQLVQSTHPAIPKSGSKGSVSASMNALRELFARAAVPQTKRRPLFEGVREVSSVARARAQVILPGRPTVRIAW
ncbi:hypothetical protein ID866_3685 [Astraeus odoratus]|nr:hypothetical protein ID866_3685 [Astraeus odoratus]